MSDNNKIYAATMAGDLSDATGKFVKLDGSGNLVPIAASTDIAVGVIDHVVPGTDKVGVALSGAHTRVKVSAAVKRFAIGTIAVTTLDIGPYAAVADTQRLCQFLADGAPGEYVNAIIL